MPRRPPYWKEGGLTNSTVLSADIKDLEIVNADISASAAIAYSKLALTDSIVNADISDASKIQSGKISFFKSTEQTGSGSEQNIAHGLGRVPGLVIVVSSDDGAVTGAVTLTEGTHDATNVKVTATSGAKYKVIAL